MSSRHVSVRIPSDLYEKIVSISAMERVTVTAIVQTALEMFVDEYVKNQYDTSKKLRSKISPITKPVSIAKSLKLKDVAELI